MILVFQSTYVSKLLWYEAKARRRTIGHLVLYTTTMDSEPKNTNSSGHYHQHPSSNGQLQGLLLMNNQFAHSSVMIRTNCLQGACLNSENWALPFWRLRPVATNSPVTLHSNPPHVLLECLEVPTSISRTKKQLIEERAKKMSLHAIAALCADTRLDTQSFIKPATISTLIDCANGGITKLPLFNSCSYKASFQGLVRRLPCVFQGKKRNLKGN